jgi:hypothetical protein
MPNQRGTLEAIALTLARLLLPLEERLAQGEIRLLFAELGLQFPPSLDSATAFTNKAKSVVNSVKQLPGLVGDLVEAIDDEDYGAIASKGLELIGLIGKTIDDIDGLASALQAAGPFAGIPPADLNQFANDLPGRLLEYLVARNLEAIRGLDEALELIGMLELTDENVGSVDPAKPPYTKRSLNIEALSDFLESPIEHLKARYGWGTTSFNGTQLLQTAQKLLAKSGMPAVLDTTVSPPVLDVLFAEISAKTDINPRGLVIRISDTLHIDNTAPIEQADWKLEFGLDADLAVGAELIIQPDDNVIFIPPSGDFQGEIFVRWTGGQASGDPYLVFGMAGGSRVEAGQMIVKASAGLSWNSSSNQAQGSFKVSGEIKNGKIVITLGDADGFLGTLLSGFGLESDFDLGFGYSSKEGVFFFGSATLEIQLPLHVALGPVEIDALTISIGLQGATFPIALSTNIKAALGPLVALVEEIGVQASLSLPDDRSGNMGPVDFALAFKPPKGVGLSIDAGIVKGGGYLFFDFEKEEYAGALELTFSEFLSLKAIGLITTRMPDGSKGFSLLIIITAEFGTGLQLGFGFTLLGVGGLLGLNRTMRLEPLMEGVRTGAIESVMFPSNVVENAPRIISDLQAFFPPQDGIFLIGPMAKLGWGTPTLISLSLGIIIEIPGNIAILGVLKVILPDEDAALLRLQVNFAGAIEFDKSRAYFFAALFESRVLFMTIEGEMGLLIAWGGDANFVVSVGGFHPSFNPPPLPFPSPKRISISILNEPFGRIQVQGYFAVTSNTVQFGAQADLFFGLDELNISGHIGFDALFQFSPFYFIIEISASVELKVFGAGLFSIRLRFTLSGPTPWRAKGSGSLSILFFEISADFDFTWGESQNTTLPPIQVLPLLQAEFEKSESWTAKLPAGSNLLVTLRKLEGTADALVLHPVGVLRVSQRAVPLNLSVDKVGNQKADDANLFSLKVGGDGLGKAGEASESFAMAQFQDMDDAEKLSRPAYQAQPSGLELSVQGQQLATSKLVKRVVTYEVEIIDTNFRQFSMHFFNFWKSLFDHFLLGSAVTESVLSQAYKKKFSPFEERIKVSAETFTVANTNNNKAYRAESASFASEALAREYLRKQTVADPNLAEQLHVIPQTEVNSSL